MSSLSFIKKPVTDIRKCVESIKDMNEVKKSYEEGDLTVLSYERKIKDNKIIFVKNAIPLATTAVVAALLGSAELYEGFQNGTQFADVISSQFGNVSNLFSTSFTESSKPVLDSLSQLDANSVSEYCSYIGKGTVDFLSKMKDQYVNTSYVLGLVSVYGSMHALTGGIDFLAGDTKDMHKLRDMDTENMKLNILRKHYHDPVFDSLNNEEMYSMMVTFNKTLHKYHLGKKKVIKNILGFIDKVGSSLITPFRKVFNSSTNDKSQMINSVYNYIENDIDFKSPESTYQRYGVQREDFKILAAKECGLTKKDMINYIFKTNNKAMVNAYKIKLKDDTMLAFSLKLEEIAHAPSITPKHVNEMRKFKTFISGYERNKTHLRGLKLPTDLKEMNDIISYFDKNTVHSLQRITLDKRHKNYTNFLERNAPHLIERSDDKKKVNINNYSFLSYFEAEKERIVKHSLIKFKIEEYTEAKQMASEAMDRIRYNQLDLKIKGFEKDLIQYNRIFERKSLENSEVKTSMHGVNKKISSAYRDPSLSDDSSVESYVVNHMLSNEKDLLSGAGLDERGLDLNDVEKAQVLGTLSDYAFTKEKTRSIKDSRLDFKRNGNQFQTK